MLAPPLGAGSTAAPSPGEVFGCERIEAGARRALFRVTLGVSGPSPVDAVGARLIVVDAGATLRLPALPGPPRPPAPGSTVTLGFAIAPSAIPLGLELGDRVLALPEPQAAGRSSSASSAPSGRPLPRHVLPARSRRSSATPPRAHATTRRASVARRCASATRRCAAATRRGGKPTRPRAGATRRSPSATKAPARAPRRWPERDEVRPGARRRAGRPRRGPAHGLARRGCRARRQRTRRVAARRPPAAPAATPRVAAGAGRAARRGAPRQRFSGSARRRCSQRCSRGRRTMASQIAGSAAWLRPAPRARRGPLLARGRSARRPPRHPGHVPRAVPARRRALRPGLDAPCGGRGDRVRARPGARPRASSPASTRAARAAPPSSSPTPGSATASTATATAIATRTTPPMRSRRWRATCARRARRRTGPATLRAYNHSDDYVTSVEALAASLRQDASRPQRAATGRRRRGISTRSRPVGTSARGWPDSRPQAPEARRRLEVSR